MKKTIFLLTVFIMFFSVTTSHAQPLNNTTVDGYRALWFTLGQETEYGYKYSGGLGGTYTAKHNPIAIYAPEVNKTFFVYGGTTTEKEKHLLCMIGYYDHDSGMVCKPRVVFDKEKVNDPHDNAALSIDKDGYLWVFVSGRAHTRKGFKYRSVKPYDISGFEKIQTRNMTYPQPIYVDGKGFFHFFTQYTGHRQLYYETSTDGYNWTETRHLADIKEPWETKSGQYQVSAHFGEKIMTAFNRHPNGEVDKRTNLYFIQTTDFGKTWTTADGREVQIPIQNIDDPSLIFECQSQGKNLYVKDLNYDKNGNPVILYLTSNGHEPGPKNGPREWRVSHWTGSEWRHHVVTTSTHNYDMGSIWIEGDLWRIIAPTDPGPYLWGAGGEVVSWESRNAGKTWKRKITYTMNSPRNHTYVRRPLNAKDPFYAFWTDGNVERISKCYLYFGDSRGNVYRLPYNMKTEFAVPERIKYE